MMLKLKRNAPLLLIAVAACSKAEFGGKGGHHSGGDVRPASGQENPLNEPLDVSKLDVNKELAKEGPQAGKGAVLDKAIELDCEHQTGVVVDVVPGPANEGDEPIPPPTDGGKDPGKDPGKTLRLLGDGKQPDLDKDGKPIGEPGKPEGGKPGKPGKPDLPPAPPVPVPETANVHATVRGAFCPESKNKLTVLFVVDYSGSMGRHIPAKGQAEVPGNDPQVNGSCGRLRAAQAIIDKIKAEKKAGDTVEIGMVPFAGGIVTKKVMPIAGLDQFAGAVNKDTFCQYVVQDASFGYDPQNPGGIDGGAGFLGLFGVDASTNYKAAFTAAQSVLSGVYGRKVVYFISDGEPTSGGADPIAAGVEAGNALRQSVDNLTLNALVLGNVPQAESVLAQVAGAPERVRRADNADQLAQAILDFPEASIDESTGKAWLTVAPYQPRADLGLRYLKADPSRAGVWIWETQPFVLLGKPGETVANVVEVTALGKDGSTHAATVQINFKQ